MLGSAEYVDMFKKLYGARVAQPGIETKVVVPGFTWILMGSNVWFHSISPISGKVSAATDGILYVQMLRAS
jgi:hypothetical protein